ncbi:MAG TPA: GLPGLI family protein, partial [Chitinophagaceae bacterium]|nr:GLPGLI family protein [Chitinophagaceae bacterium]
MKKTVLLLSLFFTMKLYAQQFISTGMIEFEVRTNNHKTFGDGIWAEMFKDKLPQFSTKYYSFTFSNNKALYKYERQDEKNKIPFGGGNEEENIWFSDYAAGTFTDQKFVFDDTYLLSDSLMKIDWKLSPNETREIAGFNCRKATGKIFDSVYVFA